MRKFFIIILLFFITPLTMGEESQSNKIKKFYESPNLLVENIIIALRQENPIQFARMIPDTIDLLRWFNKLWITDEELLLEQSSLLRRSHYYSIKIGDSSFRDDWSSGIEHLFYYIKGINKTIFKSGNKVEITFTPDKKINPLRKPHTKIKITKIKTNIYHHEIYQRADMHIFFENNWILEVKKCILSDKGWFFLGDIKWFQLIDNK